MSAGDGSGCSEDSLLRAIAAAPAVEPPTALPQPGDSFGRFQLGERLGSGATGVVFAARDRVLGREVAIKVLALGAFAQGARAHVLAEARSAARIEHRGVATVFDVLEVDGALAIVLERVSGETLRRRLRRTGRLSQQRALFIVAQAARAAAAAHRAGIVHRDLKPENMMVTHDDEVKLLDFGLAAAIGRAGVADFAGTPAYQAPEARRGRACPASDQLSLAIVLVEALTGTRPTNAQRLPSGIHRRLKRVVMRALAAAPEDRFVSCDVFADRLEALARGRERERVASSIAVVSFALASLSWPAAEQPSLPVVQSTPELEPPSLVACVPLAVGSPEQGWLGAAAGSIACRQARALLGGARARAWPPAQLLALPSAPSADFARDPFGLPDTRARALGAAARSERVIIDGSVERERRSFRVHLTARWRGELMAEGRGEGTLVLATTLATEQLFAGAFLQPAEAVDDEVLAIDDGATIEGLANMAFAESAAKTASSLGQARERLAAAAGDDIIAAIRDAELAAGQGEQVEVAAPAIDDTTPMTFARTAVAHALLGGGTPAAALAERIAIVRSGAADEVSALELLRAESELRLFAAQRGEARTLALAAMLEDPWDAPWMVLAHTSYGRPEFATFSRSYCAWAPEVADAWNIAAHADTSAADRLAMLERAYVLSDGFPLFAGNYGAWLLIGQRSDDARAVMAELALGTRGQQIAAQKLGVEIALSEGRVAGAFDGAWRALSELPRVASIETGDVALLALYVELGVLLGKNGEAAQRVFDTFVAPEPPRIDPGAFAQAAIAHACAYGARALAARCFARLEALSARGYFPMGDTGDAAAFVEGARAFAARDAPAAARAFRRVQAELGGLTSVAALAFERAGDLERADAIDPPRAGVLAGVSQSHARNARRAYERGDCARALPLAQGIEHALAKADVELAVVPEMRRIIKRCCPATAGCGG